MDKYESPDRDTPNNPRQFVGYLAMLVRLDSYLLRSAVNELVIDSRRNAPSFE